MREHRHRYAGLLEFPGTDRKRFKGDPAPVQVQQGNTSQSQAPWGPQAAYLGGSPNQEQINPQTGALSYVPVTGIFQRANELYNSQNPQFFPNSTVTPWNSAQNQGFQSGVATAGAGDPTTAAANKTAQAYLGGNFSDPAIQGAMDAARRAVQPAIDTRFSQAGRSFSPGHAQALGQGITQATAPILFGAQQNAMGQAPGLSVASYNPSNQLMNLGQQQQGQGQTELNSQIDRWNFDQNRESNKLAQYLQMIQGNYGGTTTGLNTAQQTQSGSKGDMQTAGNVLKIAGMAAGASDRRLKRDIRRIGRLQSGLPVYRFKYRWDHTREHVGVMADECLNYCPEAVSYEHGYGRVDYARVH